MARRIPSSDSRVIPASFSVAMVVWLTASAVTGREESLAVFVLAFASTLFVSCWVSAAAARQKRHRLLPIGAYADWMFGQHGEVTRAIRSSQFPNSPSMAPDHLDALLSARDRAFLAELAARNPSTLDDWPGVQRRADDD